MSERISDELGPCPFCGSRAEMRHRSPGSGGYWEIVCTSEDCSGVLHEDTEQLARSKWNRTASVGQRIAALEAERDRLGQALSAPVLEEVFQWLLDEPQPDESMAAMTKRFRDCIWNIRKALQQSSAINIMTKKEKL